MLVVADDIGSVSGKVVIEENIGEAEVEDEDAEVEELAENKVGKVPVRLVPDHIVRSEVGVDDLLHVIFVSQDKG